MNLRLWRTDLSLRVDDTGFDGIKLLQDTDAFCYGVDAVLLADFAKAGPEDTVLDLCSGNGAVAFILYAKYHPAKVCGLELQEAAAGLAQESAKLNGLSERISFTCGDALDISEHFSQGSFSLVVCNPPYFEDGRGVSCGSDPKHLARHESTAGLEDFFSAAEYALKAGGSLCMIHRPERLADLMELSRRHGLEPKTRRMVVPSFGQAARQVLLHFVKGAGKQLTVLAELAVREKDGSFTKEIERIYGRA